MFLLFYFCFVFIINGDVWWSAFISCLVSGWCFTLRGSVFCPLDWRALGLLVHTELCLHSFCCTDTPLCLHKGEQLVQLTTHNLAMLYQLLSSIGHVFHINSSHCVKGTVSECFFKFKLKINTETQKVLT